MRTLRLTLGRADFVLPACGAAATLLAAYVSVQMGATLGFGLVAVVAFFCLSVLAFLVVPHVAVAVTIPLFAIVPVTKVLVTPTIGPVKDLVTLAAIVAALGVLVVERREGSRSARVDRRVLLGVALLLGLYVLNVGGAHDVAWAQGVRLIGEPLLLLVAGLMLANPRKTLHWAMASLVVTACGAAFYGLVQQVVGSWGLVAWGYSFSREVRNYNGHLRSFGPFDDPFGYAGFLLFALVGVIFWMRRGILAVACGALLVCGIAVSYERTAILIVAALVGLWIGRRGSVTSAVLVVAAAVAAAFMILLTGAGATQTTSYRSGNSTLTLNGRTSAWKAALGPPVDWPFGRGVGEVGTAAYRAHYTLTPGQSRGKLPSTARAVDSGYLATIADVGLVGLAVLLFLLGRLVALASRTIRAGSGAGWIAAGLLAVLMLDAVTRSSFTGFPTGFLGLLLVGLCLATAAEDVRAGKSLEKRRVASRRPLGRLATQQ